MTNKDEPKIDVLKVCSVVCTTYNHAAYARAAIGSIARQDYPHIEIIVVDDGSTDGNPDVLRDALQTSGRPFKLILQENTGNVAKNCNRGLAAATGDYVSMLSLDDVLYPDCISSKMEQLCADPKLAFAANTCNVEIDANGRVTNANFRSELYGKLLSTAEELLEYEFRYIGTFFVQGAVFRSDVVRDFGAYDEDMTGDDLIFRTKLFRTMANRPELRFALVHNPAMAYRKHGNNIHRNTWRQVKTVVEWKNRYFPDRPLPELGVRWAEHLFAYSVKLNRPEDTRLAIEFDPQLAEIYQAYRSNWSFRKRRAKAATRNLFRTIGLRLRDFGIRLAGGRQGSAR